MHDIVPAAGTSVATQEDADLFARLMEKSYSAATRRAWRKDWLHFTAWCASVARVALPATPATVAAFIEAEMEADRGEDGIGYSPATIKRRVATIVRAHGIAGHDNPADTKKHEIVRTALKANVRRGTTRKQAQALDRDTANQAIGAVRGSLALKDIRDIAIVLCARDLLSRGGELVAITRGAITWNEAKGTATVKFRRFKTQTEAHPHPLSPAATAALRRWLEAAGIADPAAFVFQSVTRPGRKDPKITGRATGKPLSVKDVTRALKRLVGDEFSSHSARVGMACELAQVANLAGPVICQAAGWSSDEMLQRYIEQGDAENGAVANYYGSKRR